MHLFDLSSFPSISLADSTKSDDVPLRPKSSPIVISSSSFENHEDRNMVRVSEINSKLRSNIVNLEDDEDTIPIEQKVAFYSCCLFVNQL